MTNPSSTSVVPPKPRATRSAVTNGRRLFGRPIKDHGRLRRYRDLVDEFSRSLGGFSSLSEAQRQSVRRCAALSLNLEDAEARLVEGVTTDHESFARASQTLARLFQGLGLMPRTGTLVPQGPGGSGGSEPARHGWDLSNLDASELEILYRLALKAGVDLVEQEDGSGPIRTA